MRPIHPGSTFKPVTAIAAMQEHILEPFESLPCTGSYEKTGTTFKNWDPFVNEAMTLPTALARVLRHLLLPGRLSLLRDAGRARAAPAARGRAGSASASRTGIDLGAGAHRAAADAGLAQETYTKKTDPERLGDRQALEAGRLDPARDRPEGPARDADADGALLRHDRERRQARHAAPAARRRAADVERTARRRSLPTPPPPAPEPTNVDAQALAGRPRRPLPGDARLARDVRVDLRRLPDPDLREDRNGREGDRSRRRLPRLFDQSWFCGYGPSDSPGPRRLRDDRERRPRRRRGGAGRAEGVRGVLRQGGDRPGTDPLATDGRLRLQRREQPRAHAVAKPPTSRRSSAGSTGS